MHSSTLFVTEGSLNVDTFVYDRNFGSCKFLQICVISDANTIFTVESILQFKVPLQYVQCEIEYILGFVTTAWSLPTSWRRLLCLDWFPYSVPPRNAEQKSVMV